MTRKTRQAPRTRPVVRTIEIKATFRVEYKELVSAVAYNLATFNYQVIGFRNRQNVEDAYGWWKENGDDNTHDEEEPYWQQAEDIVEQYFPELVGEPTYAAEPPLTVQTMHDRFANAKLYDPKVQYPNEALKNSNRREYDRMLAAWRRSHDKGWQQFEDDVATVLGVTHHPKAKQLMLLLRTEHGSFSEVWEHAQKYAELLKGYHVAPGEKAPGRERSKH